MFDLKTKPWHIHVESIEEMVAAQVWLFQQGITWCDGGTKPDCLTSRVLTNYFVKDGKGNAFELNKDGFMHSAYSSEFRYENYELELQFEKREVVVDFKFPTVETLEQKKIRELEEVIAKAQEQINELKGEM